MIYCFGNCQMQFLGEALEGRGLPVVTRQLSSPISYLKSDGSIPAELAAHLDAYELHDCLHERSLINQFCLLEPSEKPVLALFNLFHENEPLFAHSRNGYVFFIDPASMERSPEFAGWIKDEFQIIKLNPLSYFQRFSQMIERFRVAHPDVPIVLLTRLGHYPAFGPRPYSYLRSWDETWQSAIPAMEQWAATLPNCLAIDLNRIFAGIVERGESSIDAHCPFLRFEKKTGPDGREGLEMQRDVEHIGSMWPRLAEIVDTLVRSGQFVYEADECVPACWMNEPSAPHYVSDETLVRWLASGSNYLAARAIGHFVMHLQHDFTPLLVETASYMPVCHNMLHMVKYYSKLRPGDWIQRWCELHEPNAAAFMGNGQVFRDRYLSAMKEMAAQ